MEIKVGEKVFKIRELLNKELRGFPQILDTDSPEEKERKNQESIKQETMLSAGLSEKEFDDLTRKEFLSLRLAIYKLNTPEKDFLDAN